MFESALIVCSTVAANWMSSDFMRQNFFLFYNFLHFGIHISLWHYWCPSLWCLPAGVGLEFSFGPRMFSVFHLLTSIRFFPPDELLFTHSFYWPGNFAYFDELTYVSLLGFPHIQISYAWEVLSIWHPCSTCEAILHLVWAAESNARSPTRILISSSDFLG